MQGVCCFSVVGHCCVQFLSFLLSSLLYRSFFSSARGWLALFSSVPVLPYSPIPFFFPSFLLSTFSSFFLRPGWWPLVCSVQAPSSHLSSCLCRSFFISPRVWLGLVCSPLSVFPYFPFLLLRSVFPLSFVPYLGVRCTGSSRSGRSLLFSLSLFLDWQI